MAAHNPCEPGSGAKGYCCDETSRTDGRIARAHHISGPRGDFNAVPRIVGVNTIKMEQTTIQLSSTEAPETDPICVAAHGSKSAGGVAARNALIERSNGRAWGCHTEGVDEHRRIVGARSLTIDARKVVLASGPLSNPPSAECPIIGNVGRRGERIYHVPGQL